LGEFFGGDFDVLGAAKESVDEGFIGLTSSPVRPPHIGGLMKTFYREVLSRLKDGL
jgi:hypothetical protein